MTPGSIVLVHLAHPTEKYWGVLRQLDATGVVVRGIRLESFDEWLIELAGGENQGLGPVTMFVPMSRVERMFLDERVGGVESYRERFAGRVGRGVETFLGA